ncbi:MAG: type III pantothenate kinase [Pseudomonadota bacterium]|nr:type III pantothenate kinase [Pseudomonadota bacterium]
MSTAKNEWLFDLGNSRLKFAQRVLGGAGDVGDVGYLAHAEADRLGDLPAAVHGEIAWVAAVASPARQAELIDALGQRFARISFARSAACCGRLQIAYAEPGRLGVDRFLCLLAASREPRSRLLVGVGTALTIDLVAADGRHIGGRIAPSPSLMRESLHARAKQLPLSGGEAHTFAIDTLDALASGCEGAALALIEHSRAAAHAQLGDELELWLHGGGADALAERLASCRRVPNLVLRGLADWARQGDHA